MGCAARLAVGLALATTIAVAVAAPYRPASDDEVLERLPATSRSARSTQRAAALRELARQPGQLALALRVAESYVADLATEGDPRFVGYAQAALAPWWQQPDPPIEVRVLRATLLQFNHRFDEALADLDAVVRQDPGHAAAWAWIAAISMVRADYGRAREACAHAAARVSALNAIACRASVDAATGQAAPAAAALQQALRDHPDAPPAERLWALTRLAETLDRLGRDADAEAAYHQALDLGIDDGYLKAAWADFLLDHRRPAEVLHLLESRTASDLFLLRLALAAKAAGHPALTTWTRLLQARFEAARQRGDRVHEKEESRFALELLGRPDLALPLAERNFEVQREVADARALLEAALAAGQPARAAPVLTWMRRSGIECRQLQALASRLEAAR